MRRAASLAMLSDADGVAYAFWKLATAKVQHAGSVDRVDWEAVELATVRESIGAHGQSSDAVVEVLCQHSPGAVTVARQMALQETVQSMAPELQAAYESRSKTDDNPL